MTGEPATSAAPAVKLDVIGDIHGQLPALLALLDELGYDVHGDTFDRHDGQVRHLVFVGDLIDRGAYSLEVAQLVERLVAEDRATCLMGNHEFNLVAYFDPNMTRYSKPKHSQAATIDDVKKRPDAWAPVLEFMRRLPLTIALPELRIIHAVWHTPSIAALWRTLSLSSIPEPGDTTISQLAAHVRRHVVLESPFSAIGGLHDGIPPRTALLDQPPHEVVMKGYEVSTDTPFVDNDGKTREQIRVCWWSDPRAEPVVPRDRTTVFGHYWNLPVAAAPPHPSGHPALRTWLETNAPAVADRGSVDRDDNAVCIDFNGLTLVDERACVGAYRFPEQVVTWATAAKV